MMADTTIDQHSYDTESSPSEANSGKNKHKELRAAARAMGQDVRWLRKSLDVLHVIEGFEGDAGGEIVEAATRQAQAVIAELRAQLDHLADMIGRPVDVTDTGEAKDTQEVRWAS
jgi:hypothetical protein